MSASPPDDIMSAALYIRSLKTKTYLTRAEKELRNRAKLKIAFWACRAENIAASRENLVYILGEDAKEIMTKFDKYLERDDGKGTQTRKRTGGTPGSTSFWEDA